MWKNKVSSDSAQARVLEELMLQVNEMIYRKGVVSQQIYREAKIQIPSSVQSRESD